MGDQEEARVGARVGSWWGLDLSGIPRLGFIQPSWGSEKGQVRRGILSAGET